MFWTDTRGIGLKLVLTACLMLERDDVGELVFVCMGALLAIRKLNIDCTTHNQTIVVLCYNFRGVSLRYRQNSLSLLSSDII
jgi:hypothetical protein